MFGIFSEFLYLFRTDMKAKIMEYDVFPMQARPLLSNQLKQHNEVESVFRPGHKEPVRAGRDGSTRILRGSPDKHDQHWLGTYFLSKSQFKDATDHSVAALNGGFNHRIVYCHILEAAMRLSGNTSLAAIRIGEIVCHVTKAFRSVESVTPPLPGYQRFENWPLSRPRQRPLGGIAKSVRLGVRGNTKN